MCLTFRSLFRSFRCSSKGVCQASAFTNDFASRSRGHLLLSLSWHTESCASSCRFRVFYNTLLFFPSPVSTSTDLIQDLVSLSNDVTLLCPVPVPACRVSPNSVNVVQGNYGHTQCCSVGVSGLKAK